MENGWQMKCGVKLANSSTRAPPSSEQIQLQESSNQRMNMNTSHCILPHDAREQGPLNPQVKQAPTSNILNFGSYKPINPESGFLFHSLLSAPESLLQYDFQRQSSMHSSGGVCIPDTSAQGIVGTMPNLSSLQNRSNFNARAGVDVRPIFQPGSIMNANNGNNCGISDDLDTLRAFVTPAGPRHETGINTPLQTGVNCTSGSSNLLDASLQTSSSLIKKENSVLSGCPRVFCMGACGDLLLSSTGLFGILCSCHGMHMSVSKFCEHSGLSDVNPGYAVRVDSGESIAHWRKLYLQKFGIRAPGDHRGWDWPEGFLATSGLPNSSMAVADRRKVFDLSSLFNSSAESPTHVRNNISTSKPRSSQPNQISKKAQWVNNGCDHYKMSSFSNNLHNTTISCPSLRSFTPPLPSGNGGSGDSCQSRSFHFLSSGENSFNSAFQNLQSVSVGSKVKSNLKDDVVMQRDTIPSSIELKLGQPSQLSWSSGSTALSAVRSHTNCVQTTTVHGKLNCNLENAKVADRNKEHIFCHTTSDFSRTKEPFQAGPQNNASISFQAVQALTSTKGIAPSAHMEHLGDGLHNTFAISTLDPPSSAIVGRSLYHKKITKRMTNGHSFSPWALHHQPHVDRSVLIDFSCNKDPPIRPPDSNKFASLNNKSRTMDETCGHKKSNFDSDLSSRLYAKQMESSGFPRAGKTCNPNTSALFAASSSRLRMDDMLSNVSVAPNHIGNTHTMASNLDQHQFSSKLKNSSISFTTIPVVPTTSTSFSPLSAVLTPRHGSVSFSKDFDAVNSRASEDCMKFLALGKKDKSFNEKPMDASLVFNTQPRIHFDERQQNNNCGMSDLGPQGLFTGQRSFEGQRLGRPLSGGHTVLPSFFSDGHKKGLDLGAISEEMTLQSELTVKYNEDPCNPQQKQQSLPSAGRQENMECGCNMVQGCDGGSSSQISNRCNGNVQTLCSKREQESGSSSVYGLKKQASTAVIETPKYNGSRFFDDISTGKVIPVDCSHHVKEHRFKSDCGNSQWINIPSRANTISKLKCTNAPTHTIETREAAEASMKEHAVKPAPRTNQAAELLEGKESSDISSGCSAPVVTHASNEVNMIDSVTLDACNTMCNSNQIADQGSAFSRRCSSVEGLEAIDSIRSSELDYDGKTRSTEEESLMVLENAALYSMINESKQTYPKSNELQNFTLCGGNLSDMSNKLQNENEFNPRKRKRTNKWKALGKPFTVPELSLLPSESRVCASATNHHAPTEDVPELLKPNLNSTNVNVNSSYKSLKRRRSALSSVKTLYENPDLTHLNGIDNSVEVQLDDQLPLVGNDGSVDMAKNAAITNLEQVKPADAVRKQMKDTVAGEGYWLHNSISDGNMKCSSKGCQKLKPVACGKYGIIYDQEFDVVQLKPPKIVPLSQVLKASKRNAKSDKSVPSTRRKKSGVKKRLDVSFRSNRSQVNRYNKARLCHSQVVDASIQENQRRHLDNTQSDDLVGSVGIGVDGVERNLSVSTSCSAVLSKTKEIRMRSLHELSMRDISHSQNVMFAPPTVCGLEMITPKNILMCDGGASRTAGKRFCRKPHCSSMISEAEGLCCVCGISNKDNANSLLECGHCLIRIHQACYGIARVPKGDWYCRPCRTSSKDVACVLCGYGGGAMTRAFGSRNVVKSLLKAWDIRTEPNIMSVGSAEALYVPAKIERRDSMESAAFNFHPSIEPVVHNSIVTGLFDTTVKQWVHMVCGLWTPGTRCPNVDTMSAFDVSGVSHLNEHMVCYICNRAGGSCIRCRVETCYTHFHPWCAHHKGLLQSEVEGVDSDQVGFYGRCLLHANPQASHSENHRDTDKLNSEPEREEEPTCARTEGYKGKKQRVENYSSSQYSGKGGCLVTQVQLDAWLYINRHKLRWNKQPKPPLSDVDHDYRKEYTRYKQAKGWKHLVVYKSGIHALGLYTSQLFQRGAMIVEYVGEIVGHRVADKRETEYMSGRKLQYKSACYFFRIDKEQIIDATCKGGIARFVNHSCQPNCVAKVLTIRGDKKVVFFAQRDIFPGEEITYDYHFNHEDEGKKIPCFCNSKNCRRYLN